MRCLRGLSYGDGWKICSRRGRDNDLRSVSLEWLVLQALSCFRGGA